MTNTPTVVATWLSAIIINRLALSKFYDIALRDFGLLPAALGRLAQVYAGSSPFALQQTKTK